MKCQVCNEREATIQLTKVINGAKTELHLCDQCASKEALNLYQVDFSNFINEFLNIEGKSNKKSSPDQTIPHKSVCENCNMTFDQFKKGGKLGCDQCYDAFEEYLEPLIKRIHGRTVHTGKIPVNGSAELQHKRELTEMQQKLKEAIQAENYELAAEYRDIIRFLKGQETENGKLGDES